MNLKKKIVNFVLVGVLMVSFSTTVKAEEHIPNVNDVFPENQVKQLEERVKEKPIYNDKDENGNFSKVMTRAAGTYPTRSGAILVTADKYNGLIPTGHAAIIWTASTVVESLGDGVTTDLMIGIHQRGHVMG